MDHIKLNATVFREAKEDFGNSVIHGREFVICIIFIHHTLCYQLNNVLENKTPAVQFLLGRNLTSN